MGTDENPLLNLYTAGNISSDFHSLKLNNLLGLVRPSLSEEFRVKNVVTMDIKLRIQSGGLYKESKKVYLKILPMILKWKSKLTPAPSSKPQLTNFFCPPSTEKLNKNPPDRHKALIIPTCSTCSSITLY